MMLPTTRRDVLKAMGAIAGSGVLAFAGHADEQAMGTGTFEELLPMLKTIASLDYTGFECNNHLVKTEFANPAEARRKIQATEDLQK
jgi:hypothetical protein